MVFDRASTYSATKPLDIDVRVDPKGQRVTVRFNSGPATATLGELLAALKANADFDERFAAGFSDCAQGDPKTVLGLVTARNQSVSSSGTGRTVFAMQVNFSAFVDTVNNDALLTDVLAAAAVRTRPSAAETLADGITRIRTAASDTGGGLTIASDILVLDDTNLVVNASPSLPTVGADTAATAGPVQSIRYEVATARVSNLPKARDLVETVSGHGGGTEVPGPPVIPAITARTAVATGYAVDAVTGADNTGAQDTVDENLNGASQVRISVSSSVKAPR